MAVYKTPTESRAVLDVYTQAQVDEGLLGERHAASVSQPRPGELSDRYTSALVGGRDGAAADGADHVHSLGLVRRVVGAGYVAVRDRVVLVPGGQLVVRAAYRRDVNPTDPSGDTVRLGLQWLDKELAPVSNVVLSDVTLTSAMGRQSRTYILGEVGDPLATHERPALGLYAVPYIRTFGSDGHTDVEMLDVSDQAVAAPAVIIPDGFEWPPETIPDYSVERVFYVSQGGSDGNNGESLRKPVRSIERARDLVEGYDGPATIMVYPGEYATAGHIDFPDNCSGVVGAGAARSTRIIPTSGNEEKNQFRLGDGGYVQGFSFEGWRVDDLDDPSEGFAISFRPGAIINRAVYAHNITVWRGSPPVLIPPPLDRANGNPLVGRGAGVALADRATVSGYSVFPQIMLWGATPVSPNGIGYLAKNGAFINGINAVALWMHKQYMCLSGGQMILTNCASQFGDYTLWSEGSTLEVVPGVTAGPITVQTAASDAVVAAKVSIVNAMWTATNAAYPGLDEDKTRKDGGILVDSIAFDFAAGQQESVQRFAAGMFNYAGDRVFPSGALAAFVFAWNNIRTQVKALAGVGAAADSMVDGLIDALIATVTTPVKRTKPSNITAVGHQWNNVMAGVNGRALSRPSLEVPDSIIERSLGTITFSGIDDRGKLYFTGGALVNPLTGQFEGPPVDRTILPRARRAATIVGGYS